MTINELEQGIRNLIATQPMATTGANGDVIRGISSIMDAVRNLNFRVHKYPCQDIMKYGLANECAKYENALCSLAIQVLQERGINLMLYIAPTQSRFGPMVNQYGMINQQVDPNLMMGQMMYGPAPLSMPTAGAPLMNQVPTGAGAMGKPVYNNVQPTVVGNPYRGRAVKNTTAGYANAGGVVEIKPAEATAESVQTPIAKREVITPKPEKVQPVSVEDETIKLIEELNNSPEQPVNVVEDVLPEAVETEKQSPAEMLMGESLGETGKPSKAHGRDYLLELLKK